jgi:hypothetical protein
MTGKEIRLKMTEPFLIRDDDCRTVLKKVCVKGGAIYASDGRSAIRIKEADLQDDVPEGWPLEGLEGIYEAARKDEGEWWQFDSAIYESMLDFKKALDEAVAEHKADVEDDFKQAEEMICPHCGETVYRLRGELLTKEDIEGTPPTEEDFRCLADVKAGDRLTLLDFGLLKKGHEAVGIAGKWKLTHEGETPKLYGVSYDGNVEVLICCMHPDARRDGNIKIKLEMKAARTRGEQNPGGEP